jgi:hypothetical protein
MPISIEFGNVASEGTMARKVSTSGVAEFSSRQNEHSSKTASAIVRPRTCR